MKKPLLHLIALLLVLFVPAAAHARPTQDERVVRAAYAKVRDYNKAAYVQEMNAGGEWIADAVALQFELRDFQNGPVSEILGLRWSDLVTPASGDVIEGVRRTWSENGGPKQLTYPAQWTAGEWASFDDGRWTVGEVFALASETFRDVSRYTSYEVTVTLEGRSRTYRAVAFFHDLYDGGARAEIADNVTGRGGELTLMLYDELAPYRAGGTGRENRGPLRLRTDAAPGLSRLRVATHGQEPWTPRDGTEHTDGAHGANATFTYGCSYDSNTEQRCFVNASATPVETGNVSTYGKSHNVAIAVDGQVQLAPTGTSISCGGAAAVAVKSCFVFCGISMSVSWNGVGATMTGDSDMMWSDKRGFGRTCNLPTKYEGHGGGCSTTTFQNEDIECETPILIDVDGDGYALTSAQGGVPFDLDSNGAPEKLSWTAAGEDDAFLVLDRNGNGRIDDGRELFGNFTVQAESANPNGFLALAELDRAANGGDGNGIVDAGDAGFAALRLWKDADHDGISTAGELVPLGSQGVTRLHLAYKEARRVDEYGNAFRYRAKVDTAKQADVARWAWDVFLVRE